jgi:hypothetical protein
LNFEILYFFIITALSELWNNKCKKSYGISGTNIWYKARILLASGKKRYMIVRGWAAILPDNIAKETEHGLIHNEGTAGRCSG